VGVLTEKVQLSSYFQPDQYCVFIPYTTMGQLADTKYLDVMVFQTVDPMQQARALAPGPRGARSGASFQSE